MKLRMPTGMISLSLLAMVLFSAASLAIAPILIVEQAREEIARQLSSASRLEARFSREKEIGDLHAKLQTQRPDRSVLLQGETTGIAGANLQRLLSGLAQRHRATIQSLQVLPPEEDGDLQRISARMTIHVDTMGLREILLALETGAPILFIEVVEARVPNRSAQLSDPHFMGPLDVTLQVGGYLMADKAA